MNLSNSSKSDINFSILLKYTHNENLTMEALQTLIKELPHDIMNLRLAFDALDKKCLSYWVDKLCDISLYCGMEKIEFLTKEIYKNIHTQELNNLGGLIRQLEKAAEDAVNVINDELKDHGF